MFSYNFEKKFAKMDQLTALEESVLKVTSNLSLPERERSVVEMYKEIIKSNPLGSLERLNATNQLILMSSGQLNLHMQRLQQLQVVNPEVPDVPDQANP